MPDNPQPPGSGLVEWFIRNPVAANLLMLFLLIGGLMVMNSMRPQSFPSISPAVVSVDVPYPGATPAEVEQGITRRIEEAVIGVDGVKRVTSSARENIGILSIELADFVNREKVKDDVETAIDRLIDFPPENAEEAVISVPVVRNNVVSLAVLGAVPPLELRRAAETLERHLLNQTGVSLVGLVGDRDYEIAIEVSEDTLRRYGLSFDEVATAVRASSIDLAGGSIDTRSGEILLRTNQERQSGEAFESIVVRTDTDGSQILLSDIAIVRDGFSRGRLRNTYNGRPAIFVEVQAAEAEGTLDVRASVDEALETIDLGDDIDVVVFRDETVFLAERIMLLLKNGLFGFALVFFFLAFMLDLKLAVWVSTGIFIAFMGGFMLFGAAGVTITMVSTTALIIVLGLVVDDAIVIGENIDAQRAFGKTGTQAAIDGLRGVIAPVLVGVMTTIFAFAPLLFQTGTFADITRAIPTVVICVLIISLVEAFLILPSHLAHSGNWSRGILARVQQRIARNLAWFSERIVSRFVRFAVKWRYATLGAAAAFTIFSIGLVSNGVVRFIFFPLIETNVLAVTVTLPEGSPFERTDAATDQLIEAISNVAETAREERDEDLIMSMVVTVGGTAAIGGGPETSGFTAQENLGQIQLELTPFGVRRMSAEDVRRAWVEEVGEIPGIERLAFTTAGPGLGVDLSFELSHEDEGKLIEATDMLKRAIADVPGTEQIKDSFDLGKRQLVFELTPAGLAAGLTPTDVARQVRQAFFGEEVQRIQRGREEVLVYVRYPDSARQSLAALDEFRIRLADGASVPLNTVATAKESRAYSVIERIDGRRVVTVEATVDRSVNTPGSANAELVTRVLPQLEATFPALSIVTGGDTQDRANDQAAIGQGFLVALIAIFAIVATQLRSYFQPFAIIIAVPLAAGGAIIGHLILGYPLSFISGFGIIALAGVAINASVVLMDLYNKMRADGASSIDAAAEAARRRFRPIMLTTLTTGLGLGPLILETSPQAQFLIPMAISLGFGIVFSGFMVLIVTPAVALIIEDLQALPARLIRLVSGPRQPPSDETAPAR